MTHRDEFLSRLSRFLDVLESARRRDNKTISVWSGDVEVVTEALAALRLAASPSSGALAMKEACKQVALDHTPRKHEGTLAAHVVGMNIAAAIDTIVPADGVREWIDKIRMGFQDAALAQTEGGKSSDDGCICQTYHRRGYCTEPGCTYAAKLSEATTAPADLPPDWKQDQAETTRIKPKPDPADDAAVAWQYLRADGKWCACWKPNADEMRTAPSRFRPLYTHPAKAVDVEQLRELIETFDINNSDWGFRRGVILALLNASSETEGGR